MSQKKDQDTKSLKNRDALSLREFCERMGVGMTLAAAEAKSGRLRTVRCGTRRLVPASECEAWLSRLEKEGGK